MDASDAYEGFARLPPNVGYLVLGGWDVAALVQRAGVGVGKTTLARATLARAGQAGLAGSEGHCLDLTGTPFGPVIEALRQVVTSRSATGVSVPSSAKWLTTDLMASGDALERVLAAAAVLAVEQRMVLVLEDLHWSDRSTRDFGLALVRTCRSPVLAARSAEHPSRPAISDFTLSPGAVQLVMDGLATAGVAELAHEKLGRALSDVERTANEPVGRRPAGAERARRVRRHLVNSRFLTRPTGNKRRTRLTATP